MSYCHYCHVTQAEHATNRAACIQLPDQNPSMDPRFDEDLDRQLSDLASESTISCISSWCSSHYLDTESEDSFFLGNSTTLGNLIGIQAIPPMQQNHAIICDKYKFMVKMAKEETRKNVLETNCDKCGYMSATMIKVRALIACGGAQRRTSLSLADLLKKKSTYKVSLRIE